MPREKNIRKLSFKPMFKSYVPKKCPSNGHTILLHEEIEAIYLMDSLGLYQEEAAKRMEVSRPTFTRILKNARTKLANGLICGHEITLEDDLNESILAICSDTTHNISNSVPTARYILLIKQSDEKIEQLEVLDNPSFQNIKKPAIALPQLLLDNNVNTFVASKVGEGLKNSLMLKGIKVLLKKIDKVTEIV